MQYNPPFFSTSARPNCTTYNNAYTPQYQHQCSTYPDVVGEGEVTSLVLPDGSVQLYFLPLNNKWSLPHLPFNTGCNRCNANRVWFVRSVTTVASPPPPPYNQFFNVPPPSPYPVIYPTPFGSNFAIQPQYSPPCLLPAFQFHNDKCTSSTDLHYFCPLRKSVSHKGVQVASRTQNQSAATNEKCHIDRSAETGEGDDSMSIDEKGGRHHKGHEKQNKRVKCGCSSSQRDKKRNARPKRKESSTSTEYSGNDMSIDGSALRPSKTTCSSTSFTQTGYSDMSLDSQPSEAGPIKVTCECSSPEKNKSKSKSGTSGDNCRICESCTTQDVEYRRPKTKWKSRSKESGTDLSQVTCECSRPKKKSKSPPVICECSRPEKKTKKKGGSKESGTPGDNCGVCESCTSQEPDRSQMKWESKTETTTTRSRSKELSGDSCKDCGSCTIPRDNCGVCASCTTPEVKKTGSKSKSGDDCGVCASCATDEESSEGTTTTTNIKKKSRFRDFLSRLPC